MTTTVTNLLAGPAKSVWIADFGATEPANLAASPGAGWRDIGGTTGGLRLVADREFFRLDVDQKIGRVGSVPTTEDFSVQTSMAEATLENYADALNVALSKIDTSVAGEKSLELGNTEPGSAPNYRALLIEGRAPNGKARRVIVRKVLSTATVESGMEKAGQTVYPVTWSAHEVSDSILPVRIIDEDEI